MTNKLNLLLDTNSKEQLKGLVGEHLGRVLTESVGSEMALLAVLETKNRKVLIRNNVDLHFEYGDEFIQLVVSERTTAENNKHVSIPQDNGELIYELSTQYENLGTIAGIRIVNDRVEWENENGVFEAEADVAIIIDLDGGRQIIFQAVDSLAGFIAYCDDEEMLDSVEGQWKMKTDSLKSHSRTVNSMEA